MSLSPVEHRGVVVSVALTIPVAGERVLLREHEHARSSADPDLVVGDFDASRATEVPAGSALLLVLDRADKT